MKTKLLLHSICLLLAGHLAAAESIEVSMRNMFKALDTGDRASFKQYTPTRDIRFPVQMFDYDWDNKPVVIQGVDGVNAYLEKLFDELAKRKLKVASTLSNMKTDSRSPELGFAVFDLSQTMTADGKSETAKFFVTMLVTQDKTSGKWRVFHGHSTILPLASPPGR
jgi:hypothetical protein